MVENYDYIERFSEHETVSLIIVNSSAVLEIVPGGYPEITNADFVLTEADVEEDAMHISESLNAEQNLKFGSINPSKFEVDIFNKASLSSLKDTQIAVYLYFDGDSSTLFQVGVYVVKMDEYSDDRSTRHLTCFDVLQDLYDYDITKLYNYLYKSATVLTIKELRDAIFEWLSTPKSQTTSMGIKGSGYDYPVEQEETDLVNDDFEVEKSIESDVVTFGFLMQGLLEANGVFGHIDRTGIFRYISLETYDQDPKRLITEDDSFKPVVYEDYHVWGIGYVAIWNRNNLRIAYEGSSAYTYPSVYNIIDSFVFSNNAGIAGREDDIKQAALNLRDMITHMWYYPIESECEGNLCYEVGDRINLENVTYDEETDGIDDDIPIVKNLYSYILQREFTGLQEFIDLYVAKGDRKQPRYKITNDNWHEGDSGSSGSVDGNDGTGEVVDDSATKYIQYQRNNGIRFLLEPSNVSVTYVKELDNHHVEIKWKDPNDITTYRPEPQTWAGTIIVRSDSHVPVHPWDDCEILVDSTTRDEYLEEPFIDDTIEHNKKYYYGIFPYSIIEDNEDPAKVKKRYRFTKVVSVNTQGTLLASIITDLSVDGTSVTVSFTIPELETSEYTSIKLVAKKGNIPTSASDGKVTSLNPTDTNKIVTGLDELSKYYFVIFSEDSFGNKAESDPGGPVRTGKQDGIFKIRITTSQGVKDNDFKEVITITQQ